MSPCVKGQTFLSQLFLQAVSLQAPRLTQVLVPTVHLAGPKASSAPVCTANPQAPGPGVGRWVAAGNETSEGSLSSGSLPSSRFAPLHPKDALYILQAQR